MAILTKFLQLLKPEKNDYVDVEKHLSENYDKIDTKMEELSNSNDKKLDKGAVSTEYDTAKKIEDKIKTKLNQGNVPNVLNSAEKIFKALQGNTGIKFDENLLYLNDSGTKKKGLCYLDKLTDGIFECIQETTTTVNNTTYFKNFSNKENSDRLSNLINYNFKQITKTISKGKNNISISEFGIDINSISYFEIGITVDADGGIYWVPGFKDNGELENHGFCAFFSSISQGWATSETKSSDSYIAFNTRQITIIVPHQLNATLFLKYYTF